MAHDPERMVFGPIKSKPLFTPQAVQLKLIFLCHILSSVSWHLTIENQKPAARIEPVTSLYETTMVTFVATTSLHCHLPRGFQSIFILAILR